jgi:non-homologous end joining protein Ku
VLVEKLRQKKSLHPAKSAPSVPSRQNVINLMDALKASLGVQKPLAQSKGRSKIAKQPAAKAPNKRPKTR